MVEARSFSPQRRRVLVVGAASNAAGGFRRRLAEDGWNDVVLLARLPIDTRRSEQLIVVADHFAPPASVFGGVDAAINFAGVVDGTEEAMRIANSQGPARLAALAKQNGVRHFVQISSLSVYGAAADIDRSTSERPLTEYGRSKYAEDVALRGLSD